MTKLNREELLKNLKLVQPGISTRGLVPQSACVHFTHDALVASNGSIYVAVPFCTGIEGAVNWEKLYEIVNKLEAEELQISLHNNELRLFSGNVRVGIAITEDTLPLLQVDETRFVPVSKELVNALKFCQFSASKDVTRPHLTCIHVKSNKVCSSDNWRISQVILQQESPFDFLLPAGSVQYLDSHNTTSMAIDSSWIHFKNTDSGFLISVRLLSEDFIEVDEFFEVQGAFVQLPSRLTKAIERATVVAEEESAMVDIKVDLILETGKITCVAHKPTVWIEETIEADYDGPKVSLSVNPHFMLQILEHTTTAIIGDTCCLLFNDTFRHVMTLMGG